MLCLAHNLGKWRTEALQQPVWRYRFDLVAANLNSQGASIGTFHGEKYAQDQHIVKFDRPLGEDIRFVMGYVEESKSEDVTEDSPGQQIRLCLIHRLYQYLHSSKWFRIIWWKHGQTSLKVVLDALA